MEPKQDELPRVTLKREPKSPLEPKQDKLPGVTLKSEPKSPKSPGQFPADDTDPVLDAGTQTPFSLPPSVVVVANGAQLTTHSV